MHAVVMESLEEYLGGLLEPAGRRAIEAHLNACQTCRDEVGAMREVSAMFGALRCDENPVPAPGFYARVMQQVGERKAVPSFASLFGLNLVFGRRLAFASLVTLAVLGSYLVSRETGYANQLTPDAVIAEQNSPGFETVSAQDNMLITLTAYER